MGAGAVGAGTVLSGFANMSNMDAQSRAEGDNIRGFQQQQRDAAYVFDRKLKLLQTDQDKYMGSLDSAFAKSGIDFSGSMLDLYSQTEKDMREERLALRAEATSVNNRFDSEIRNAQNRQDALNDPMTRGMTLLGGGLSAAGSMYGRGA